MKMIKSLLSLTFFLMCFCTTHAEPPEKINNDYYNICSASDSIPSRFEEMILSQNPLFIKAKLNGKWGTIGLDGKTIIPFEYERISLGRSNDAYYKQLIYVRKKDGKKTTEGLFTLKGEVILPARFESVRPPSKIRVFEPKIPNLFGVRLEGKWGYANRKGEIVIPCNYDWCSIFFEGRAIVRKKIDQRGESYLINEKGEILTQEGYASISKFYSNNNLLKVRNHNGKYGMINLDGEVKVPIVYDKLFVRNSAKIQYNGSPYMLRNRYQIQDNFIRLFQGGECLGLFSDSGEMLLPCTKGVLWFKYYFGLSKERALTSFEGQLLLDSTFETATAYYQNYYIVKKNGMSGIIDILTEEMILPCVYDNIYGHSKTCALDLFVVEQGGKEGLVNIANEIIIPIEYKSIRVNKFYDIVLVTKEDKTAIWDIRGNPVTDFDFDGLWGEDYEPFIAKKGMKYGYVNRKGKEVLPFIYEKPSNFLPVDSLGYLDESSLLSCNDEVKGREFLTIVKTGESESRYMNVRGDTLDLVPTPFDGDSVEVFFEEGEDDDYRMYMEKEGQGKIYGNDIDQEVLAEKILKNYGFMSVNNYTLYCLKNHRSIGVEEMQDTRELKRPICWIKRGGQYYFINNLGEKINDLSFDKIGEESEGLTAVAKDGKIGFINEKVELVIPYKFDDAYNQVPSFDFKKGVSIAFKNKKYGFIDKKGKTLIPFHFEAICYFDGEIGIGYREGKWEKVTF